MAKIFSETDKHRCYMRTSFTDFVVQSLIIQLSLEDYSPVPDTGRLHRVNVVLLSYKKQTFIELTVNGALKLGEKRQTFSDVSGA